MQNTLFQGPILEYVDFVALLAELEVQLGGGATRFTSLSEFAFKLAEVFKVDRLSILSQTDLEIVVIGFEMVFLKNGGRFLASMQPRSFTLQLPGLGSESVTSLDLGLLLDRVSIYRVILLCGRL